MRTPVLERETRAVTLHAWVTDAEKRPDSNRVVLSDFSIPGIEPKATPRHLRITMPASYELPPVGARISMRAVLRPVSGPVLPDGFQFQRFLYFESIGGGGYTLGKWQREDPPQDLTLMERFHVWTDALRRTIGAHINAVVPGGDGAVAAALINGEQNAIPDDLQEAYRVSGIAHLLSISGVHMSLLAGVVFFVMRRLLALAPSLALRIDTKKVAAVVSLAVITFYVVISGMSVPAVRSFLMIGVVMVAILLDRTALSVRTIAWAAVVLMALYPDAVFGASFQMSFVAVLALVSLYEQTWLRVRWRAPDGRFLIFHAAAVYMAGLVVTDIVAGGATSLFAAYHFNRLPTYSAVTNLAAVPLTGLWIMPSAILGLILMPFGGDAIPLRVMGEGVTLLDNLARTVAGWPGAQVHVPPMETWALVTGTLGIIFVCLWKGRWRWVGFAALVPAIVQPLLTAPPDFLVDDTARVFAVSDSRGRLVIKPGRAGAFVREAWTDRYGASEALWPKNGESAAILGVACDGAGCILKRRGQKLLMAFTAVGLAEDCEDVQAAVSTVAARDLCRQENVTDIIDLKREGAALFWLTEKGIRKRSVADATGNRVWMRGVLNAEDAEEEAP